MSAIARWVKEKSNAEAKPISTAGLAAEHKEFKSKACVQSLNVAPPSDQEKYSYIIFAPRFLPLTMGLLFSPILFSLSKFALLSPVLWTLFVWVAVQAANLTLGAYTSNKKHLVTLKSHLATVKLSNPLTIKSIDVFLPTAGEPMQVLENTYFYVSKLNWDGVLKVHVMDDAARPEVRQAAAAFGFNYIVRPNRPELKKAGNLRHAYSKTNGDFILVLDADFVPRPDMLQEMIGYFVDPKVGIVQTPQYFDVNRTQNWLQRSAGATQELFYRYIQPSRDNSNSAICVGTCAMYRREALKAAKGFAPIGHSEDVHTGVRLAKAGYALKYVPVLLAKGLCPDQMHSFVNQQYRWATGSFSLFSDRSFWQDQHFTKRRLAPYITGFAYYLTTGISVYVSSIPVLLMLFGFTSFINPQNFSPLLGIVFSQFVLLPLVTKGRLNPSVLRVQTVYGFAHARAIFDHVLGRSAEWVATGSKIRAKSRSHQIVTGMVIFLTASLILQLVGLIYAHSLIGWGKVWPALFFYLFSVYIYAPIIGYRWTLYEKGQAHD
jgi:cellulose synthase/poly-beta-1,6-N-acetylglucosamine synthase-like glycosyltransferase